MSFLSPDGRCAVVSDAGYGGVGDLWTLDLSNDRRTRLSFGNDVRSFGVWSPDGERIAYAAGNLGDTLYEKASSGAGEATELLKESGIRLYPTSHRRERGEEAAPTARAPSQASLRVSKRVGRSPQAAVSLSSTGTAASRS